jgi:hypothetical protein
MLLPRTAPVHNAPCNALFVGVSIFLAVLVQGFLGTAKTIGQDNAQLPLKPESLSLGQINADFDAFLKLHATFETTYERIGKVFEDTDRDLAAIKNEGIQQQFAVIALTMARFQIGDAIATLPLPDPNSNRIEFNKRALEINNLSVAQTQADIEVAMRSEQVRQLSLTQQSTIRRRLEAANDFQKLQQDLLDWQNKWPTFFDQYWRFTDPEFIRTKAENNEILEQLKLASARNIPARMTQALVELRLGDSATSLATLTETIHHETPLKPVALAARASVYAYRDEKQKSKADMQHALRLAPKNNYVQWYRALVAAKYSDVGTAKKELGSLVNLQTHEIAARRLLAILSSTAQKPGPRDAATALQHAELVSDLTGEDDWYSELVLSMALKVSGDNKKALATAEHAKELAQDENQELCESVMDWIEHNNQLHWKFIR